MPKKVKIPEKSEFSKVKLFQVFPCVIIGGAASIKVERVEKLESVFRKRRNSNGKTFTRAKQHL